MKKVIFVIAVIFFLTMLFAPILINAQATIHNPQQIGQTGRNQKVSRGFEVASDTALFNSKIWIPGDSAGVGKVFTSDANGFGAWETATGGGGSSLASNGLSLDGDSVILGGAINRPTFITFNPQTNNVFFGDSTGFVNAFVSDSGYSYGLYYGYVDEVGGAVLLSVSDLINLKSNSSIYLSASDDIDISVGHNASISAVGNANISAQENASFSSDKEVLISAGTNFAAEAHVPDVIASAAGSGMILRRPFDYQLGFYAQSDSFGNRYANMYYGHLDSSNVITDLTRAQVTPNGFDVYLVHNAYGEAESNFKLDSFGLSTNLPFQNGVYDSAVIFTLITPNRGRQVYCDDCTPANGLGNGVMLFGDGSLWRRGW